MLKINGKLVGINKVNEITIKDNVVVINGKEINAKDYSDNCIINIEVDGDVHGNITTNGSVEVSGNVEGNIDTNGNVNCYGDINGDIDTNGNVSLRIK